MSVCQRSMLLDAYLDGELGRLGRWRAARHVARCGECALELRRLEQVGEWVRRASALDASPDLWEGIAERLPELKASPPEGAPARAGWRIPRLAFPVGAGLAAATAVLALTLLRPEADASGPGVVRSLYASEPVIVLEDSEESTIIWMVDPVPEQHSQEVRNALG